MKSSNQTSIQTAGVAEISISYSSIVKPSERPKIGCSKDACQILRDNWSEGSIEHREEFRIILLNRANKVLGVFLVSVGGFAGTICDPKVVFQAALKANASSIILSHNHPSGNLQPSGADLELTKKLKKGGELLELAVLDHLILTQEAYLSMADEGLI